jgi:A/G-specific adenine glycosylase
MLGLPTSEWRERPYNEAEAAAAAPIAARWRDAGRVEHVFTHFALTLDVRRTVCNGDLEAIWTPKTELDALPSVFLKAARSAL